MKLDPKIWEKLRSVVYVATGAVGFFTLYNVHRGNERFYDKCLMPVLHRFDPETTHKFAVIAAKYSKALLPEAATDTASLKIEFLGLKLTNPLGLAAGFDKDAEAVESLLRLGFGFVEIGSVTPLPQPGNPKPRVFRLKNNQAIINRYGFNSQGHDIVVENLRNRSSVNGIVGVNLGKNKESTDLINDYVLGIQRFSPYADYLVINISSPNTPGLRDWQHGRELEQLLIAVIAARNAQPDRRPLLLKLSPDLLPTEREQIAKIINKPECRIDGLVISNTTVQRPAEVADEAVNGGLSGAPLRDLSTRLIHDMYALTKGQIPIIGVGGIFTGKEAFDKIAAGASVVQIYTALTYHGPPRINRIKKELNDCLVKHGYASISEAVGRNHRKV